MLNSELSLIIQEGYVFQDENYLNACLNRWGREMLNYLKLEHFVKVLTLFISLLALVIFVILFCSCTNMKVVELDETTKRFPAKTKATIVKNVPTNLDSMNSLLLLPDNNLVTGQIAKSLLLLPSEDFVKGQISSINYFKKTITLDELETIIIKNGLTDKVPSLRDKIGINKAFKAYKPFLWLRFENRTENGKLYGQFILTKPDTLEDIFVVEKIFDYNFVGISDQTTWYPMFNALVDYIDANSITW